MVGVGYKKLWKLAAGVGMQCPTKSSVLSQGCKVQNAIKELGKECLLANQCEHNQLAHGQPDYQGDIKWKGPDGMQQSTAQGPVDTDGAGDKRSYKNWHTGSQHCSVMNSQPSKKLIALHHTQISCVSCSRELTKNLNAGKDITHAISTNHCSTCYKTSCHGPATAEENLAEILACNLLLDKSGDYAGDDLAVFVDTVVGDGNMRAVERFIAEQEWVIGEIVNGIAECFPDIGHAIKCISDKWYRLAEKDKSLKGMNLLESTRIQAMCSNIVKAFEWLHDMLKEIAEPLNAVKSQFLRECLVHVNNIVLHHCAIHENCKPNICGIVELKEQHPDWGL